MIKKYLILISYFLLSTLFSSQASGQDFPYGSVPLSDLTMTRYPQDTSAGAVVLKEFGEAFISNGDNYNLIFKYHVRIKVLNKNGLGQADIEIPLYRQDDRVEKVTSIRGSSFNIQDGQIHEEVLQDKNVFTEDRHKYLTVRKFAIPNVREGSVIELAYTIESPFIFNFRTWEFQSDIPKTESEYHASIPGTYVYNITLRGFLKLTKNDSRLIKNCLGGSDPRAGGSADCALMQFGMKNIPAFVEEDYMTARKNFVSAIHFELSEVRYFDGRIDKITREWKDAEDELRRDSRFGVQLKRGKDIGDEVKALVAGESDDLSKARHVYDLIRDRYVWNDTYGKYSEFGIKKAFNEGKGNVGDINLSLVAAMRFAGLDAEPVILSTRSNGSVVELHPVLSEFNYVVAKVNIGDHSWLADATEKHYPFGILPERCLNGKGRVIGDRSSYWIDLKPSDVRKTVTMLSLVLTPDGVMRGSLHTTFAGYDAVNKRQEISSFSSVEAYITDLRKSLGAVMVTGFEIKGLDNADEPFSRKLDIEIHAFDAMNASNVLFNPYFLDKWKENPFKSRERLYPVDFGVPLERLTVFNLEYPEELEIVNVPEKIGMSLPNAGGRFLLDARNINNKLSLTHSLSIRRPVYSSEEYHYLKEMFNRIIQVQNGDLIFRKKS